MNLQQSSDFEMTASAGEGFRRFHSLGRANKCNLTTSSLFRFSGLNSLIFFYYFIFNLAELDHIDVKE